MLKTDIAKRVKNTLEKEEKALKIIKNALNEGFYDAVNLVAARTGKILVTGIGKSGLIGQKISSTLTSLGHGSFFLHPTEALHGDSGLVQSGDIVVAISSSGETAELVKLIKYLKRNFDIKIVSITTKSPNSTIAKLSDAAIVARIDDEGCPLGLAPMASTTASLVMGDLLASGLTSPRTFQHKHFAKFHPAGSLGLSLKKVSDVMKTKDLPIVSDITPLQKVLIEIADKKLGVVAVVSKKKLVGIITDGDVRRFFISNDSSAGKTAADAMKTAPKTIDEKASLKEALATMEAFKITTLFAVNKKGNLAGIIHIHDILEDFVI